MNQTWLATSLQMAVSIGQTEFKRVVQYFVNLAITGEAKAAANQGQKMIKAKKDH